MKLVFKSEIVAFLFGSFNNDILHLVFLDRNFCFWNDFCLFGRNFIILGASFQFFEFMKFWVWDEFWIFGIWRNFVFWGSEEILHFWASDEILHFLKFRHYLKNAKFHHCLRNAKSHHCLRNLKNVNFVFKNINFDTKKNKISTPKK